MRNACGAMAYGRHVGIGALLNLLSQAASLLAAAAGLGGFLGHARLAISGAPEAKLRQATALGGLLGIVAVSLGVLSAVALGLTL